MNNRLNNRFINEEIPSEESSNCSVCIRQLYSAANQDNPFLYYAIYAGHYEALDHFFKERVGFASLLILYTEKGEASLSVDNGPLLTIHPGSVMVFDCRRHHIYYPTKTPWNFYYLHIDGRDSLLFANALPHSEQPVYEYSEANREKIKSLIEKAILMPKEISVARDLQMSSLIYQLLMVLLDYSDDLMNSKTSENIVKLRYAENYMREHLAEPIEMEALAKQVFLSRTYFTSLFRRYNGISPYQYLTILRINRAKQILVETDQPIGSIAALVGYGDVSAFTRCFSHMTGMTPRQFREIR